MVHYIASRDIMWSCTYPANECIIYIVTMNLRRFHVVGSALAVEGFQVSVEFVEEIAKVGCVRLACCTERLTWLVLGCDLHVVVSSSWLALVLACGSGYLMCT